MTSERPSTTISRTAAHAGIAWRGSPPTRRRSPGCPAMSSGRPPRPPSAAGSRGAARRRGRPCDLLAVGRHARPARARGAGGRRPDDPARSGPDRGVARRSRPARARRPCRQASLPPVRRWMSSSPGFGCAPRRPWTIRSRPSSNRSSVVASSSRSSTGRSRRTTTTGTRSRPSAGPIAAGSPRPITTAWPGSRIGARRSAKPATFTAVEAALVVGASDGRGDRLRPAARQAAAAGHRRRRMPGQRGRRHPGRGVPVR